MAEAIPTIKVKHLETGATCTINAVDFDEKIHEKVGKERKALKAGAIEDKDDDKAPKTDAKK